MTRRRVLIGPCSPAAPLGHLQQRLGQPGAAGRAAVPSLADRAPAAAVAVVAPRQPREALAADRVPGAAEEDGRGARHQQAHRALQLLVQVYAEERGGGGVRHLATGHQVPLEAPYPVSITTQHRPCPPWSLVIAQCLFVSLCGAEQQLCRPAPDTSLQLSPAAPTQESHQQPAHRRPGRYQTADGK